MVYARVCKAWWHIMYFLSLTDQTWERRVLVDSFVMEMRALSKLR
jgi:hypothetical protein